MRDDRDLAREPGPQPDPMLRSGRARPLLIWTIALACVAVVVLVLIAIAPPLTNTAGVVNGPQSGQSSGPAGTTPRTAMPASRDNSNAAPTPPVARPLTDERGATTGTGATPR
jgi:hypothetical protein